MNVHILKLQAYLSLELEKTARTNLKKWFLFPFTEFLQRMSKMKLVLFVILCITVVLATDDVKSTEEVKEKSTEKSTEKPAENPKDENAKTETVRIFFRYILVHKFLKRQF